MAIGSDPVTTSPDALSPATASGFPLWLKTALTYIVALAALLYVIQQLDTDALLQEIRTLHWPLAAMAYVCLHGAQLVSAQRMRLYARLRHLPMRRIYAVLLYYAGMLYNTVLPGGIGGDGYKVWVLSKVANCPMAEGIRVMLGERASGLLALVLLALALVPMSGVWALVPLPWLFIPLAALVTLVAYRMGTSRLTQESVPASMVAFIFSLVAQGLTLYAAWLLLEAMGIYDHRVDYLVIFLLSSVITILPVTVAGMGLRELVFFTGALELGIEPEQAVAFSLVYFMLYLTTALSGLLAMPFLYRVRP